ncbi:MAG: phosphate acyltransferase PlsX [Owenweeksia sp.]|nr:phosphate acyltransferase PlsX [Owenweeksia sp.]
MPNIGIDIMGGDQAPQVVLEGCYRALAGINDNSSLHLVGPSGRIKSFFDSRRPVKGSWQIVEAPDFIGMEEHPVKALQQKPKASLSVGFAHLANRKLDGFASAGHSGAVMVAALQALGCVAGVDRPMAATAFPQQGPYPHILLDAGINVDVRPAQFSQFALLGSIYASEVHGIPSPRVALLNTGVEESKGSALYQRAHQQLKDLKAINFVGNLEARDFYENRADVSVCDGFTGNIFLKQAEGFYNLLVQQGVTHPYLEKFNYEHYGGTPILGLKGNVVLGHGASSAEAIKNMILTTEKLATVNLAARIETHIKEKWQPEQQ